MENFNPQKFRAPGRAFSKAAELAARVRATLVPNQTSLFSAYRVCQWDRSDAVADTPDTPLADVVVLNGQTSPSRMGPAPVSSRDAFRELGGP